MAAETIGDSLDYIKQRIRIDGECWLWTGAKTGGTHGEKYGQFKIGRGRDSRKTVMAHRAMYELFNGPIPCGMLVMHKCDTPLCVNPDHLMIGTHNENMADMAVKARSPSGTNHSRAVLTQRAIDRAFAMDRMGSKHREIARALGVSRPTITKLLGRKTYRSCTKEQACISPRPLPNTN